MRSKNKGFTLLELAIVLAAAAIMAGAVVPSYVRSLQVEAARKTAVEMIQLSDAARSYRVKHGAWPADIKILQDGGYIGAVWSGKNVFGKPYRLLQNGKTLEIRVEIPLGVSGVVTNLVPVSAVDGVEVMASLTPFDAAGSLPIGGMMPWPSPEFPDGWLLCDGRAVSRTDYSELFNVIGTRYGNGDGENTFNIPDLRGRTVVGKDDMGGSAANVIVGAWAKVLGGTFGEETHALTIAEMPSHTHGYMESPVGGRYDGHSSPVVTGQQPAETQPAGGGQAHNIIQPSIAMNWVIKC